MTYLNTKDFVKDNNKGTAVFSIYETNHDAMIYREFREKDTKFY